MSICYNISINQPKISNKLLNFNTSLTTRAFHVQADYAYLRYDSKLK